MGPKWGGGARFISETLISHWEKTPRLALKLALIIHFANVPCIMFTLPQSSIEIGKLLDEKRLTRSSWPTVNVNWLPPNGSAPASTSLQHAPRMGDKSAPWRSLNSREKRDRRTAWVIVPYSWSISCKWPIFRSDLVRPRSYSRSCDPSFTQIHRFEAAPKEYLPADHLQTTGYDDVIGNYKSPVLELSSCWPKWIRILVTPVWFYGWNIRGHLSSTNGIYQARDYRWSKILTHLSRSEHV